jgi:transposase-like protein
MMRRQGIDVQELDTSLDYWEAKADPQYVVSDGLPAYARAFKKEFFTLKKPRIQHIRKPRFIDFTNNNIAERLNGTVREREKVMRGIKSDETAEELMNGLRTYYNFVRPHMSLKGKTSAEALGLNLELGENKWISPIKKASGSS